MERTNLQVMKAEKVFSFIKDYQISKKLNERDITKICHLIEKHVVTNHEFAI